MKKRYIEALTFTFGMHLMSVLLIAGIGFVWPAPTNDIIEVTLAAGSEDVTLEDASKESFKEEKNIWQEEQEKQNEIKDEIPDPTLKPEIKKEQKFQQKQKKTIKSVSGNQNSDHIRHGESGKDEFTSMPKLLKMIRPDYPPAARNMDKQGKVFVSLLISNRGVVEQAEITQSGGFIALDEAVLRAVYKWRFVAAKNKFGRPCACKVIIPVKFELKDPQ